MFTAAEEFRIEAIETAINNLSKALSNLMSKQQFRQLLLIREQEIETLKTQIESLQSQVATLQSNIR